MSTETIDLANLEEELNQLAEDSYSSLLLSKSPLDNESNAKIDFFEDDQSLPEVRLSLQSSLAVIIFVSSDFSD